MFVISAHREELLIRKLTPAPRDTSDAAGVHRAGGSAEPRQGRRRPVDLPVAYSKSRVSIAAPDSTLDVDPVLSVSTRAPDVPAFVDPTSGIAARAPDVTLAAQVIARVNHFGALTVFEQRSNSWPLCAIAIPVIDPLICKLELGAQIAIGDLARQTWSSEP